MSSKFAEGICNLNLDETFKYSEYIQKGFKKDGTPYGFMYRASLIGGNEKTISFLKKIYENKSDLFLERKYAKVQSKIS